MRKITLIFLVLVIGSRTLYAQQLPQYSQFMLNDFALNPAIAGTQPYFNACSDDRYQWMGIPQAPRTYVLSINGPITSEHMGLGGTLYTDITGPTRETGFSASYAYHLEITDNVNVSLGLSAGLFQFAVDGAEITLDQPGDQALTNQRLSVVVPNFGFGAYAYGNQYYFGVALPQLYPSKLQFTSLSSGQDFLSTYLYIMGGYKLDISPKFLLEPSLIFKYVYPAPLQMDLSTRVTYLKTVSLGIGFRTADAFYAMAGYIYKEMLTIGFSYDFAITDIHSYSFGTTELFIGYKFNKSRTKVTTKSQI